MGFLWLHRLNVNIIRWLIFHTLPLNSAFYLVSLEPGLEMYTSSLLLVLLYHLFSMVGGGWESALLWGHVAASGTSNAAQMEGRMDLTTCLPVKLKVKGDWCLQQHSDAKSKIHWDLFQQMQAAAFEVVLVARWPPKNTPEPDPRGRVGLFLVTTITIRLF